MAVQVRINGRRHDLEGPVSVSEVLAENGIRPEVVTVALNRAVVKRDEFASTVAADGDVVEIVLQMAGGSDVR